MKASSIRFTTSSLSVFHLCMACGLAGGAVAQEKEAVPMGKPDPQMQTVLDALATLNPKPLNELSATDARKQPGPADAVKKVMKSQGKVPEGVATIDDIKIKLSSGDIDARVYRPEGDGPFPVILYIHGGGWVIADLDTYDAAPRALANGAQALVISADYRKAPEHKFPAAHEDCYGAYQWVLANAGQYKGDAKRVALVGESAGGNMANAVSIMAQAQGIQMPVHQVLVYPVADVSMDTPSYRENAKAKPLNAPMMKWFFDQTLSNPSVDSTDPKIAPLRAKTLKGLPSTTIITAQIDPLRSEGEALAKKLEADGVKVTYRNFDGVTHEFFGMGAVVDKSKEAVALAVGNLKEAFGQSPANPAGTP